MKAAWFHCFAGVAGDMALGALVDAGADIDEIRTHLVSLGLDSWTLEAKVTQRAGIRSTHIVITDNEDGSVSRTFSDIRTLINASPLPDRVRQRSLSVFARLAEVEAHIHNSDIDHVHFHEVGGIDSILDIVGTCLALEHLGIDQVFCSPIATGYGTVEAAHGSLPVPTPAVIKLLEGAPTFSVDRRMELTTPTGAALMTTLATKFGPMPTFSPVYTSGLGAGTREIEGLPNCTQVVIGETTQLGAVGHKAVVIETNVDDVTGEVMGHALAQLMAAGAHDAWITPIVMKKGRPAHTVSVLCDSSSVAELSRVLMSETGSLGVRLHEIEKSPMVRSFATVEVRGQEITVKVGPLRVKPEFDECAELAKAEGIPVRQVIAEAEAAWAVKTRTSNF